MNLQGLFDTVIFGITARTILRVIVFGGIAAILIRKLVRKIKARRNL
ncbi:MAG: hypothetical protein AABY87_02595 [bacterium]